MICFAYDYEDYKKNRGLYLDLRKEMPSGVLSTEDEVINHIKNMNHQEECVKTKNMIKNHLLQFGGNATKMCLDKLFEK